ncbi:hypothetical protein ACFWQG_12165 [Rhodococcus sp. NPDC058532]|uniref:hypothetical protein n=1 Tax=Rhodococcus sp. NPDC058532 TaxID=3346540 RepID=UPI00364F2B26
MAYVSAWGRDGVDTASGGSWRGRDVAAACGIPGCGRPVAAAGDACAHCRVAYATTLTFGERRPMRACCWVCGGHAVDAETPCLDCAPIVGARAAATGYAVGAAPDVVGAAAVGGAEQRLASVR